MSDPKTRVLYSRYATTEPDPDWPEPPNAAPLLTPAAVASLADKKATGHEEATRLRDEIKTLTANPENSDRKTRATKVTGLLNQFFALDFKFREPVQDEIESMCRAAQHYYLFDKARIGANKRERALKASEKAAVKAESRRTKSLPAQEVSTRTEPPGYDFPGIKAAGGFRYVPFNKGFPFQDADSGAFDNRPSDWKGNVWDGIWLRIDPKCLIQPDSERGLWFAWNMTLCQISGESITEIKYPNGTPKRYMVTLVNKAYSLKIFDRRGKKGIVSIKCPVPVGGKDFGQIICEESVTVEFVHTQYDVTPDGRLDQDHPKQMIVFRDSEGMRVSMAARQTWNQNANGQIYDTLKLAVVPNAGMLNKMLRHMMKDAARSSAPVLSIRSIGPIWDADGNRILLTHSGSYAENGNKLDTHRVDLTDVLDRHDREKHDLMPPDQITPELLVKGLDILTEYFRISPQYPEVPAAMLGQKMVSAVSDLDFQFWCAIWLYGVWSSGKTYFNRLLTAIESGSIRTYSDAEPDLNMGPESTKYGAYGTLDRIRFGTVAIEDVAQDNSVQAFQNRKNLEMINGLNRSKLEGAGKQGSVDKPNDRTVIKNRGQIHVSSRITAEIPPQNDGNGENGLTSRMLVIGGFNTHDWRDWWDQKLANTTTGKLWMPDNLDAAYAAWSFVSHWVWRNWRKAGLNDLRTEARRICAGSDWPTDLGRIRDTYEVCVCGLLVLRTVAKEAGHALGTSAVIPAAIQALRDSADTRMTENLTTRDIADQILDELHLAFADGMLYATGRKIRAELNDDQDRDVMMPYRQYSEEIEGEQQPRIEFPPGASSYGDLGIKPGGDGYPKNPGATPVIVRPPVRNRGWVFLIPTGDTWITVCRKLNTRHTKNGWDIEPREAIRILTEKYPNIEKAKQRVYAVPDPNNPEDTLGSEDPHTNQVSCLVIPTELILERPDDD